MDAKAQRDEQKAMEIARVLPVVFVVLNITALYIIYSVYHLKPLLESNNIHLYHLGVFQTILFHVITVLMMICYVRAIVTHPGTIPNNDPTWEYVPSVSIGGDAPQTKETKKSGERRHCKWCAKYKPDRTHHCRVCKQCILKMDHHCPWIYNCVGFANHKYFFLLLLYSGLDCLWIASTMAPTVKDSIDGDVTFTNMFFVLFAETLATFLGLLITLFFFFHIWLMCKAMTTIEFCEKSSSNAGYDDSVHSRGLGGNIRASLGDNFFLWLLPLSPPPGNGVSFPTADTHLKRDVETGRGLRRKNRQAGYGATGWEGGRQRQSRKGSRSYYEDISSGDSMMFPTIDLIRPFKAAQSAPTPLMV